MAAMQYKDLTWHCKGITIKLPHSMTDQEAKGREVEILWGEHDRTCQVLARSRIGSRSPGFRTVVCFAAPAIREGRTGVHSNSVGRLVKQPVRKAKIAGAQDYGGHSLRAGFVTEASGNGVPDGQIMKQTGHISNAMVRRYARADREDKQAAAGKLGL
nr:tyrosine-type recombinase/integrase [Edaphobacter modestus]